MLEMIQNTIQSDPTSIVVAFAIGIAIAAFRLIYRTSRS